MAAAVSAAPGAGAGVAAAVVVRCRAEVGVVGAGFLSAEVEGRPTGAGDEESGVLHSGLAESVAFVAG
jgi:hypothetical protein